METDWTEGRPPTFVDVAVFVNGRVRVGSFDGVYLHYSDCNHPVQNGVCRGDDIAAWKYTPNSNRRSEQLLNQFSQMRNWRPPQLCNSPLAALYDLLT